MSKATVTKATAKKSTAKKSTAKKSTAKKSTAKKAMGKAVTASASKSKPRAKANANPDWRGEILAKMRALILEADPQITEERKWKKPSNAMVGVPVWSHDGIVCTGESYAKAVKLTFARGASLPDPAQLFNASLEGGTRRAIDIPEGRKIDARAFKALVKAAVALNASAKKR
jgi:hypothetical protein